LELSLSKYCRYQEAVDVHELPPSQSFRGQPGSEPADHAGGWRVLAQFDFEGRMMPRLARQAHFVTSLPAALAADPVAY
jgi:hypothetical protein